MSHNVSNFNIDELSSLLNLRKINITIWHCKDEM